MREIVERKAFLAELKHQYCVSNEENMIIVTNNKKLKIITSIQVCLITRMNNNYKENGGKKPFLANPKHPYRVSHCKEHDCVPITKRIKDY